MSDGTPTPQDKQAEQLLQRAAEGDAAAAEALLPLVYAELRAKAALIFRGQPNDHTLQPTAIVHEAYLKIVRSKSSHWNSRAHFCALAATAMRQILIDHARRRGVAANAKAERKAQVTLAGGSAEVSIDLIALHEALETLQKVDPRQSRLVELRYFGGLTVDEVAEVLELSESTIKSEWRRVRAWLHHQLAAGMPD